MIKYSNTLYFRKFLLSCATLWVLVGNLQAEPVWPHDESDLPPDPAVTWGVLDNGFRYAIMPNAEPPDRVSLRLYVGAGSLMETNDQQGLAHFLEHMAFNGSKNFPAGEMVEYFQRIGMGFGADTNAHTSFDETVYKLELPNNDAELLEVSMKLFRDYADGLFLKTEEIDKERGVILSEKRSRDSVEWRTYQAEMKFLLGDSLISKRMPIGLEKVIEDAPRDEFVDFYQKWYTTDRLVLVATGSIDAETLVPLIKEYFGSLPKTNHRPDPDLGRVVLDGVVAELHSEPEASDTTVSIQAIQPYEKQPDTSALRIKNLYRRVANNIISRRLEILAKEEGAPFTRGVAYGYDFLNFATNAGIELTCQPEQWKDALSLAEHEMRRALKYGFTEAELNEVKAKMLNDYEQAVKTAPTRKSRSLSSQLAASISDEEVFTSPETDLEVASAALEELTPAKTLKALRDNWPKDGAYLFVSGNLELEDASNTIIAAYNGSLSQPVEPPKEEEIVAFAYDNFGKPGAIVSREHLEALDVTQIIFGNNVRLNIKPTDFQKNSIAISVRFGGGLLTAPEDLPGLPQLASSVFTSGGLEAHSADDLERIFAGKTVSSSFTVDEDAFVMSGSTSPEDFETELKLLVAYLTAPGYREEALRQAHKNFERLYVQLSHTPQGVMQNEGARFLASGDYRFGFPSKEKLMERTLEEVHDWLAEPLGSAYMEVTIVGDVEVEQAVGLAAKTFGALPLRQKSKPAYTEQRKVKFPREVDRKEFPVETEIPKAIAVVYWPTDDIWDIKRTRRLSMLSNVLDDRLRVEIREKIGEAYSPSASHRASETYTGYGYMYAYIICDPGQAETLADMTRDIAAKLRREGATEDELERAKKPTLTGLKDWVRDNRYWLGTVLASSQEYPERLEWARTILSDYESITLDDVNSLAQEYLGPENALEVLVIPEPAAVATAPEGN